MPDIGQLVPVIAVFGVLAAALWLLKRRGLASFSPLWNRGPQTGARKLEVIERIALTPTHSLHLVRVSGQVVLIGVAPSVCNCLLANADDSTVSRTALAAQREAR